MSGLSVQLPLAALAAITLAALLWRGERGGEVRAKWLFKPATSALFVIVALLRGPDDAFDWWVVTGLVLSVAGDLALIPQDRRWFLVGLVAFLLGHVAYTVAFSQLAEPWSLPGTWLAACVAAGLLLFRYFRPHLGRMLWPVLAYMVVISAMLVAALSLAATDGTAFGWQVAAAAALFYLSDITVARSRFVPGAGYTDRLVGLPLYYLAQFLFAFSI